MKSDGPVRSFMVPLRHMVDSDKDYEKIANLLSKLTNHLRVTLEDDSLMTTLPKLDSLGSNGRFKNEYPTYGGKPHLGWGDIKGNKAKYQIMNIERVRSLLLSLRDRRAIAGVCESWGWDEDNLKEIWDDIKALKLYPTAGTVNNILKSGRHPELDPTDIHAFLDFTTGDKQIVRQELVGGELRSQLSIDGEWVTISSTLPKHLRENTGEFSKPIIHWSHKHDDFIVRYSYTVVCAQPDFSTGNILGVDLGRVLPFVATCTSADGSYSTALHPSREATKAYEKINTLNTELGLIHSKMDRISQLLVGKSNPELEQHWVDLDDQAKSIRSKRTRLKDHASWLIARDVVDHALKERCGVIHLEDLRWLGSKGGKWDHSLVQHKIRNIAELYSISVLLVDARGTSHTDPFTDDSVTPSRNRTVCTGGGVLNRDHCASLEVSRRPGGVRKPKKGPKRSLVPGKRRDKHHGTPKRPKRIIRVDIVRGVGVSNSNPSSGSPIAVVFSGVARSSSTTFHSCEHNGSFPLVSGRISSD